MMTGGQGSQFVAFEGNPDSSAAGMRALIVQRDDGRYARADAHRKRLPTQGRGESTQSYSDSKFTELVDRGYATLLEGAGAYIGDDKVALYAGGDFLAGINQSLNPAAGWTEVRGNIWVQVCNVDEARRQLRHWGNKAIQLATERMLQREWRPARDLCYAALSTFPPSPPGNRPDSDLERMGRLRALLRLATCYRREAKWRFEDRHERLATQIVEPEFMIAPLAWHQWTKRFAADLFEERYDSVNKDKPERLAVLAVMEILTSFDSVRERLVVLDEFTNAMRVANSLKRPGILNESTHATCSANDLERAADQMSLAAYRRPLREKFEYDRYSSEVCESRLEDVLGQSPGLHANLSFLATLVLARATVPLTQRKEKRPFELEVEKRHVIRRTRLAVAPYNFVPMSWEHVTSMARRLGVTLRDIENVPVAACSVFLKGARSEKIVYLRAGMWESSRVFLGSHELAHWLLHYRQDAAFAAPTSTSEEVHEDQANHFATIAVWPSTAMAWLAIQARATASTEDKPIQPPYSHLSSSNEKHVQLLVDFQKEQYGPLPVAEQRSEERLWEYLRYFARRRIDSYNRYLRAHVYFRSPGKKNWFSSIEVSTSNAAQIVESARQNTDGSQGSRVLNVLMNDPSVIWGIIDNKQRLVAHSTAFGRLVGEDAVTNGMEVEELFDDEVVFFKWNKRDWTSRGVFQHKVKITRQQLQPFGYYVLYRTAWKEHPGARVLCRVQTIPMVTADGAYVASFGIVEPTKTVRVDQERLIDVLPGALQERGVPIPYEDRSENWPAALQPRLFPPATSAGANKR